MSTAAYNSKWDRVADEIARDRSMIVDALNEAGVNFWRGNSCRCPFHEDKNPSGYIKQSGRTGRWYFTCPACGMNGLNIWHVIAHTRGVRPSEIMRHVRETGELLNAKVADANRPTRTTPPPRPLNGVAAMRVARAELRRHDPRLRVCSEVELDWLAVSALRPGYNRRLDAMCFPMFGPDLTICGIRTRHVATGEKRAYIGSANGIFVTEGVARGCAMLVVGEGPTDAAALVQAGFPAVAGMPGATCGFDAMDALIAYVRPARLLLVADPNRVGRACMTTVARNAAPIVPHIARVEPPDRIKDARAWVVWGADRWDILKAATAVKGRAA